MIGALIFFDMLAALALLNAVLTTAEERVGKL